MRLTALLLLGLAVAGFACEPVSIVYLPMACEDGTIELVTLDDADNVVASLGYFHPPCALISRSAREGLAAICPGYVPVRAVTGTFNPAEVCAG